MMSDANCLYESDNFISVVNILLIVSSLKSNVAIMLKWRKYLIVTGFLAPPGGPMAPRKVRSSSLTVVVSFKSYLKLMVRNIKQDFINTLSLQTHQFP